MISESEIWNEAHFSIWNQLYNVQWVFSILKQIDGMRCDFLTEQNVCPASVGFQEALMTSKPSILQQKMEFRHCFIGKDPMNSGGVQISMKRYECVTERRGGGGKGLSVFMSLFLTIWYTSIFLTVFWYTPGNSASDLFGIAKKSDPKSKANRDLQQLADKKITAWITWLVLYTLLVN